MKTKIIIIKLGALGDVIRTLPLLLGIKKKFPESEITWITKSNAVDIVKNSPYVDKVFSLNFKPIETYDILYNFDVDDSATKLANQISANKKLGFSIQDNFPTTFNLSAEYYLNTIFDDELKKTNKKTYQEMMFEVAELPYNKEHHPLFLSEEHLRYAQDFLIKNNFNKKSLVGIHLGASSRWPSKKWHKENIQEFIKKVKDSGKEVILFAGPNEKKEQEIISNELKEKNISILKNNPENTFYQFASLVDLCDVMVCSDSLSLHVSLALKKPTIGLFFCTSYNEVEEYGLLKKIISPMHKDFFPEKQDQYSELLVKSISSEEVYKILEEVLKNNLAEKVFNSIVKNNDKILLIKRKSGLHKDKWAFPGGSMNKDENFADTISRELKEETNLDLDKIIKKINIYEYYRNNKKILGTSYLVTVKNNDVIINDESSEFVWATLEDLEGLDLIEGLEEEALLAFSTSSD